MAVLRASWPFARQSLAGRRGRTILLVVAVMLASALVVATSCGVATVERSVEDSVNRALGATDARVVHRYAAAFPADVIEKLRALPDVDVVCGRLFGSLTLTRADGKPGTDGRPRRVTVEARGTDAPEHPRLREITLDKGRRPERDNEILLDPTSAATLSVELGDALRVERFGEPIELTVVGVYKRAKLGALQRPLVELSRRTLAAASNREDEITAALVLLKPNVDVNAWLERNKSVVEDPLLLEAAEKVKTGLDRQMLATRLGFVLAASIAFLSCAFIVAVGLTTAVTEQQREMAIARCVGAGRGQLFGGQVIVGACISVVGGLLGLPLGVALAWALVHHWREFLKPGLAVSPAGLVLAIVGSVLAGVLGAAYPAWQASRVTPMAALTIRARPPRPGGLGACVALGVALVAMQLALLFLPDVQWRFWAYAIVGIASLHVAYFLLAPVALTVIAAILGGAIERLVALPRGLLRTSVRSMPYRLGFTAGALMVGMSILVSTWSNASSVLNEFRDRIRFADGFVFCSSGLSEKKQAIIEALPGVEASCPVGYLPVRLAKGETLGVDGLGPPSVVCVGFDPERFLALNRLDFIRGTPEDALPKLRRGDAVLVAEQFLVARGLDVGDTIGLGGTAGDTRFEIAGVVSSAGLDIATQFFGMRAIYMEHAASCVFMDFDAVKRHFGTRDAFIMQLRLDPSRDASFDEELKRTIEEKVPGATYTSGRSIRAALDEIGDTALAVTSSVAFAALVLACFGVGNVVAAGIASRRHEFGVLRAVGGSASLLPRLVLGEALLMALAAATVGTGLGMHLATMGTVWHRDLAGVPTHLVAPWIPATIGWLVTASMTVAAALPAALSLLRVSPRALLATRS